VVLKFNQRVINTNVNNLIGAVLPQEAASEKEPRRLQSRTKSTLQDSLLYGRNSHAKPVTVSQLSFHHCGCFFMGEVV